MNKLEIGLRHWIADINSINLHGRGAPIDWTAFTDAKYGTAGKRVVPSGSAVKLSVAGKIVPADGANGSETLFMFSDAREDVTSDSVSGYGLVTGGNLYEAFLPDASGSPRVLAAGIKATVSARIRLQ